MEQEARQFSIMDLGNGALIEEINYQMKLLAENLVDPNTSFKDKRKLKIEMVFSQDEERKQVNVVSKVSATLAASKPLESRIAIGLSGGNMQAVEIVSNPGQVDIFGRTVPYGKMIDLGKVKEAVNND